VGGRAIVLGAGIGGLASANVLAKWFENVSIVERDALPCTPGERKGTPQDRHAHGLLPSGYDILDRYFPGMMDELVAEGAGRGDLTADFLWYQYGCWKLRAESGLRALGVSRPFLEAKIRERVRCLTNVEVFQQCDGEEVVYDASERRVTGVGVRDQRSGRRWLLPADLVVDCTGRGSICAKRLAAWGFGQVEETRVPIEVGYASGVFQRRPDDLGGAPGGAVVAGTAPRDRRYAAVVSTEGSRWMVMLAGVLRDYPPTDLPAWREYARSLPIRDVFELVRDREPLGPLVSYRFSSNRLRHFDRSPSFPEGYLVLGDALCSFNPIYAQGMAVALAEARALDDCLREGKTNLWRRFFGAAARVTASPWAIATGEDFRHPEVVGRRPLGFSILSRYMARAHRAAARDRIVLRRFFEVASLRAAPSAMLAPHIACRVLLGGVARL